MKFTTWASAFKKKPKNVHHVAGLTGCALRLFLVKLQGCDRKLCFFNSAWLYIDDRHSEGSCSYTAFFVLFIEKSNHRSVVRNIATDIQTTWPLGG